MVFTKYSQYCVFYVIINIIDKYLVFSNFLYNLKWIFSLAKSINFTIVMTARCYF